MYFKFEYHVLSFCTTKCTFRKFSYLIDQSNIKFSIKIPRYAKVTDIYRGEKGGYLLKLWLKLNSGQ